MANGRDDRLDTSGVLPKESIWNIRNIILMLALGAIFVYGFIARDRSSDLPPVPAATDGGRG